MFEEKYWTKASNYPKQILKGRKPFYKRFWVRYLKKIRPVGKLLDLGCGEGIFLEYAEQFYCSHGVDISEFAISIARKRCSSAKFDVSNANNICLLNEKFDIIVCFDMLEHLTDPTVVLQKCGQLLNDNGLLIISVPNISSIGQRLKGEKWHGTYDPTHVSLLSKTEWIDRIQNSGFKVIDTFYDGLWDSPYFSVIPKLVQDCLFKLPSTLSFYLGVHPPESLGENIYIISEKRIKI